MKIDSMERLGTNLERPENIKDARFREKFFDDEGPRCHYCLAMLTFESFEIDHFVPRSKGGGDEYSNLRVACHVCNRKKRNQIWEPSFESFEGPDGEYIVESVQVQVMTFEEWRDRETCEVPF